MSDTVQQIKDKLDLVSFLKPYLHMTSAGRNFKAVCPFHKEKTPSFIISPDKQIWHCFGCSAGGDLIGFLMRYENIEFIEALKILAEKAGVDMRSLGNQDNRELNVLYEINKAAKDFFIQSATVQSDDYLKNRGLKPETIKDFEIGFAPDLSDALLRYLGGKGFNAAAIEKAGLIIKTDQGTYRDRFRNRIMFPLLNAFGKVVGFTGRIAPWSNLENIGKYVNSPETPIFNKSKILFGLDKSKNHIRETKLAVLVEGQMDFLMAWQDGIKNLVAASGTAFTPEHLKALKRIAEKLVLSFDQDEAGQLATERTIDLASSMDMGVGVMKAPDDITAKDPADIVMNKPGLLKNLITESRPAMEYYLGRYQISRGSAEKIGMTELKKNLRLILSKIKIVYSPVEKAHWLKRVTELSGIEERHLSEEMDKLEVGAPKITVEDDSQIQPSIPKIKLPDSRKDLIGQRLVTLVLHHKDFYKQNDFTHLPEDYQAIMKYHFDPAGASISPELQERADFINLQSGLGVIPEFADAQTELAELFRQLKLENYKEQKSRLRDRIEEAERKGDAEASLAATSEFQKVSEEIHKLGNR